MNNQSIPPKKVLPRSLQEICKEQNDMDSFEWVRGRVQMHLFSQYSERKVLALNNLKETYGKDTEVATLEDDGLIWAYLYIQKSDCYVLVSKYLSKDPVFEEVPNNEEHASWRKELQRITQAGRNG